MSEDSARHVGPPKINGPLWVISLFLGLSEVTVSIATTQATGWIQGMLAIFAVMFPTLVTTVFFLILWHNNKILYAPREFSDSTTVSEYADAMNRSTRRNVNIVESALVKSLAGIEEKLDAIGASAKQRQEIAEYVTAAARSTVVTVDLAAFSEDASFEVPVDGRTSVAELLDAVYFGLRGKVGNLSYNRTWLLRDEKTGRSYDDIGTHWARIALRTERDFRPVREVGIAGGAQLTAYAI